MVKEERSKYLGYIFVAIAGACWGTGGLFVENLSSLGASAGVVAFNSQIFALIPMGIILFLKDGVDGFRISKNALFHTFILGSVSKGLFKLTYDTSITLVGVAMGSILLYLSPLFVAIMSVIFFKEKIGTPQKVALFLTIIGCFLMVTGGDLSNLNVSPLGIVLGITAAFLYATSSIVGRYATDGVNPITAAFYMLVFSTLTLLPITQPWTMSSLYTGSSFFFQSLLYGVVTGVLANVFFLTGLSMGISPSRATIFTSLEVVVATLIGVLLFNEFLNVVGLIGIGLMLVSIVLVNADDVRLPLLRNAKTKS